MKPLGKLDYALALGLTGAVLALYLRTLLPGVGTADAADLTTAAASLGIPHPPGYPLHTLLGWLVSRLSPDNPAYAVNALSAVCSALAAGVLALTATAWTGSRWAGLAAALALTLDPRVWHNSVVAEVFGLNNLLAALLLLLGLRLALRVGPQFPQALGVAFVYGLGAAHHHTLAFMLPGTAVLFARAGLPWGKLKFWLAMPGAFLLGISPYLMLLIRAQDNPGLNWDDPRTLGGLLHLLLRRDYGSLSLMPEEARKALGADSPWSQLPQYFGDVFAGAAVGLLVLALLGLVTRFLAEKWTALAVFLAWLFTGPAFLMLANCPLGHPYYLGVVERFYVLPQVMVALLAGAGVGWLALRGLPGQAVSMAFCGALVYLGSTHFAELDQSQNTVGEDSMRNLLATLPEHALFLTVGDNNTMLLEYAQYGLGLRPDVIVLDQDKLRYPWYVDTKRRYYSSLTIPWKVYDDGRSAALAELVAANYGTRPILFWSALDGSVEQAYRLLPAGLAQRVAEPGEKPSPAQMEKQVLDVWSRYELRSTKRSYNPRRYEYLTTSFYGYPFYSLGGEFQAAGDKKKAEEYYRKALAAAPQYAPPYRQLGKLLLDEGRVDEGKEVLRAYVQLEPDGPEADVIKDFLTR